MSDEKYEKTLSVRFFVVRHGESEKNISSHTSSIVGGAQSSSPLTEKGKQQSAKCGKYLNFLKEKGAITPDVLVFSSSAVRARDTATIACEKMGIGIKDIVFLKELEECSKGDFEGKPRDQVYTPEVKQQMKQQQDRWCPPNGESFIDAEERFVKAIETIILPKILENPETKTKSQVSVLVFTHAVLLKRFLRFVTGGSWDAFKHKVKNTALCQFDYQPSKKNWILLSWNEAPHLLVDF